MVNLDYLDLLLLVLIICNGNRTRGGNFLKRWTRGRRIFLIILGCFDNIDSSLYVILTLSV